VQLAHLRVLEHQPVGKVDGVHDRGDLVIAVGPSVENLQGQVDLGRCIDHEPTGMP